MHRLRQLWGHSLLEAASGQHRDLAAQWPCSSPQQVLEFYEDAVRAKAGSIYRIGFGGTAVLATDCQHMVDVFCRVGEAYGVLLQLNDDLLDASTESKPALTLSQAYRTACQTSGLELPPHAVHAYAQQIHQSYFEYVRRLVMTLPQPVQRVVLPLFHQAFGSGDESFSST